LVHMLFGPKIAITNFLIKQTVYTNHKRLGSTGNIKRAHRQIL